MNLHDSMLRILPVGGDYDTLESEHFYFINACRAKEKSGPFTDFLSYNSNDGVITDQEQSQIQTRM